MGGRPRSRRPGGRLARLAGVAGTRPAGCERPRRRLCPVRQVLPGLDGVHPRGGEPPPRVAVHRPQRQRPAPHHQVRGDDRRRGRAERDQRPLRRQAARRHRADRGRHLQLLQRPRELHDLRRHRGLHEQDHGRLVDQRRPDVHEDQGRRVLQREPGHRPGGPSDQQAGLGLLALVQSQHHHHEQEELDRGLVEADRPPGQAGRDGALRPAGARPAGLLPSARTAFRPPRSRPTVRRSSSRGTSCGAASRGSS